MKFIQKYLWYIIGIILLIMVAFVIRSYMRAPTAQANDIKLYRVECVSKSQNKTTIMLADDSRLVKKFADEMEAGAAPRGDVVLCELSELTDNIATSAYNVTLDSGKVAFVIQEYVTGSENTNQMRYFSNEAVLIKALCEYGDTGYLCTKYLAPDFKCPQALKTIESEFTNECELTE